MFELQLAYHVNKISAKWIYDLPCNRHCKGDFTLRRTLIASVYTSQVSYSTFTTRCLPIYR